MLSRCHPLNLPNYTVLFKKAKHAELIEPEDKVSQWKRDDPKQKEGENLLVKAISSNLLSLSVVENSDLRNLFKFLKPRFRVPGSKKLDSNLQQQSEVIKLNIVKLFGVTKNVYITLDIWSNRQMRSFVGFTAHFCVNFKLKTVMLCCKRIRGSHTAENIHKVYEDVMSRFGVARKIAGIITDNGANVVAAFNLPGFKRFSNRFQENPGDEEYDDFND